MPIFCQVFFGHKCTCFGSTYTKIGTIQRRLAWPLRKDDTQNREAFHIFRRPHHLFVDIQNICHQKCPCGKYFVSTFQFRYKMSSSAPIVGNVSKRGAARHMSELTMTQRQIREFRAVAGHSTLHRCSYFWYHLWQIKIIWIHNRISWPLFSLHWIFIVCSYVNIIFSFVTSEVC